MTEPEAAALIAEWHRLATLAQRHPSLSAHDRSGKAFAAVRDALEELGRSVEYQGHYYAAGGTYGVQSCPVPSEKVAGPFPECLA